VNTAANSRSDGGRSTQLELLNNDGVSLVMCERSAKQIVNRHDAAGISLAL
jgi:hypothetical protein